jgi:hypothetical protein
MNFGPLELIMILVVIAVPVVVIYEIVRFATRTSGYRPCARCGEPVKNGVLDCPQCGFDFRTIGAPPVA